MIGEFLIQFGDKPPRSYLFTQVLNQLQQAIQDLAKKEAKAQSMQPWLHSKGFFFPKTGHSLSVRGIGNRSLGAIPAGSPTKLVQLSQKCGWIWISEIMGVPTCSNHPKENDLIRIPMLVNVGLFWVS